MYESKILKPKIKTIIPIKNFKKRAPKLVRILKAHAIPIACNTNGMIDDGSCSKWLWNNSMINATIKELCHSLKVLQFQMF